MPRTNWDNMLEMDETFVQRVYAQVAAVPFGRVATYGKIAELAGYPRASREVGVVLGRVPDKSPLPCHRIVNKNGTLAPSHAFGSQARQRAMLADEGVTFLPDGTIDIPRHLWPDDPQGRQVSLFE